MRKSFPSHVDELSHVGGGVHRTSAGREMHQCTLELSSIPGQECLMGPRPMALGVADPGFHKPTQ